MSEAGKPPLVIEVPGLRVLPEVNRHEHWRERHKRVSKAREVVGLILNTHRPLLLPVRVLIVRRGPALLDEGDNLESACKGPRDQLAEWLGVDDSDPRVDWRCAQEKATHYSLRIEALHVPAFDPAHAGSAECRREGLSDAVRLAVGPEEAAAFVQALMGIAVGPAGRRCSVPFGRGVTLELVAPEVRPCE